MRGPRGRPFSESIDQSDDAGWFDPTVVEALCLVWQCQKECEDPHRPAGEKRAGVREITQLFSYETTVPHMHKGTRPAWLKVSLKPKESRLWIKWGCVTANSWPSCSLAPCIMVLSPSAACN